MSDAHNSPRMIVQVTKVVDMGSEPLTYEHELCNYQGMTTTQKPEIITGGDRTRVGYVRVSTKSQTNSIGEQRRQLIGHGVGVIYTDHGVSGSTDSRPGLDAALGQMHGGDTLVVTKLDRLGRSIAHLVQLANTFKAEDKGLHFIEDGIDTSTPQGRFMFNVMSAMAEMERELIRERTRTGLEAARRKGRVGGRPPKLDDDGRARARKLRDQGMTLDEIAGALKVSRATIIRALKSPAPATV